MFTHLPPYPSICLCICSLGWGFANKTPSAKPSVGLTVWHDNDAKPLETIWGSGYAETLIQLIQNMFFTLAARPRGVLA